MFTSKVLKPARQLLDSRATAKPPHQSTRLELEVLEDRTMPSASSLPAVFQASPPASSSAAAITSNVLAMLDQGIQRMATLEQNAIAVYQALAQVIVQDASSFAQQWGRTFGIYPNVQNPAPNIAAAQPSSDSGSGRGNSSGSGSGVGTPITAHNSTNRTLHNLTKQSGSGSGSGSSSTSTTRTILSKSVATKVHPLTGGAGSGSFGSGGNGTGSVGNGIGSGYANVSGNVWLDNNGDGIVNNGERGYIGIEVDLVEYSTTQPGVIVGRTPTITNATGDYSFNNIPEGPDPKPYAIQVIFSSVPYVDVFATLRTPNVSQIDGHGFSAMFDLEDGGWRKINAGVTSLSVTTVQDNPNNIALAGNKVTLRDAINAGNNGPFLDGRVLEVITFIDVANNGQPLGGTQG